MNLPKQSVPILRKNVNLAKIVSNQGGIEASESMTLSNVDVSIENGLAGANDCDCRCSCGAVFSS